jgi:predicted dehydrogenase
MHQNRLKHGTPLYSIGVVGAGQMAAEVHVPALLSLSDARLSWIVDRDNSKARVLSKAVGIQPVDMPARLSDLPYADVVLLAIPYGVRGPFYEEFKRRETGLYVEKPFASCLADHRALCGMFAPERLACGFQRRSFGSSAALREIVRCGLFGDLQSVRVEFGAPGTRAGSYQSDLRMAGGGVLFDVGIHALDLALFISGAARADVRRVEMIRDHGFDTDTEALIDIVNSEGRVSEIDLFVSTLRETCQRNIYSFEHAEVTHAMWEDGSLTVVPNRSGMKFVLGGRFAVYPRTASQMVFQHWTVFLDGIRDRSVNYTCAVETEH